MIKRLVPVGLTIYVLLVCASSAKAEPLSCAGYAVTNSEKQLVKVLQDMNAVKSEMATMDKQLKEVRSQMDREYGSSSNQSVNEYNLLVNRFNSLVSQRNQLKDKHNSLRDSFNSVVNETSSSRNTSFVLCMNGEVVETDDSTVKLNADSLEQSVDSRTKY
jgi:predicted  nucleic acid-binding Zn-ribbon protein